MIPKTITRENVIAATHIIDDNGVPKGRESKDYNAVFEDRTYPPKYLISLAAELATGLPLKPDEFGGGVETNQFLIRLGFNVRKVSVGSGIPIHVRVARAWLDMGVSRSSFRKNSADKLWREHMKIVIAQFQKDPTSYLDRLSAIARAAVESGADVLLFPACAIVHRGELDLTKALGSVPRILMSGVVDLSNAGPQETAILAHEGHISETFGSGRVLWCGGEGFSIMAAISRSIRHVYAGKPPVVESKEVPPQHDVPVLLLDAGHHPYSVRYLFQTLRCVTESAEARTGQRAVTVLSSWRCSGAKFKVSWSWPLAESGDWKTVLGIKAGDALDTIDIEFSQIK